MLGHWGMIAETGWYNAASRVTWTIFLLASLVSVSIYPILNKAFKETKEKFQEVWNYQAELIITVALPLVAGGIALAPKIIDFIYGAGFASSILAFQILIITVGILLVYNCFYHALLISNQQKKLFWIIFSGAVVNIILNLILIPRYSLYGAAVATVISYLSILFLLFRSTMKFTSIRVPYSRFLIVFIGAFISGAAMLFVVSRNQIYSLHILLSILIGIGTYLACLFAYKKLTSRLYYQKITNI
jgi:O-antigen/teichoic acid export membrane protein